MSSTQKTCATALLNTLATPDVPDPSVMETVSTGCLPGTTGCWAMYDQPFSNNDTQGNRLPATFMAKSSLDKNLAFENCNPPTVDDRFGTTPANCSLYSMSTCPSPLCSADSATQQCVSAGTGAPTRACGAMAEVCSSVGSTGPVARQSMSALSSTTGYCVVSDWPQEATGFNEVLQCYEPNDDKVYVATDASGCTTVNSSCGNGGLCGYAWPMKWISTKESCSNDDDCSGRKCMDEQSIYLAWEKVACANLNQ